MRCVSFRGSDCCRCSFGGAFLAAAADWRGKHAAGCSADGSSGSGDGRYSPRRLSGYDGCVKFLERKQRRLEILKDPHAGAFAIIMGCLYFVLYAGAAGELVWKIFPAYAFGFAVSRSFSGLSIAFFQMPIRKEQRQRLA